MCRLFAFVSVKPILLDDVLIRPKNAITKQILLYWQGAPYLMADGFGITYHTETRSNFNPITITAAQQESEEDSPLLVTDRKVIGWDGPLLPFVRGPHPVVYKTTIAKPLNDPVFLSTCANVSSKTIFAHLRAAEVPPVATTNNHPFVFGRHCFMHNGGIAGFDAILKDILRETSEGFAVMIEGGTDTEHFAALYLTYLCKPADYRGVEKHYTSRRMWTALRSAIHKVEEIQRLRGIDVDNYLNICTTDGESFLALCYRSKIGPDTPPFTLWVSTKVADKLNRWPYVLTHGKIYEDTRSDDEISKATADLVRNVKPAIERDGNGEVTGINKDLLDFIKDGEKFPDRHGPHIIVASEPTTINPFEWHLLRNRDVIMVDPALKKYRKRDLPSLEEDTEIQSIEVKAATLDSKVVRVQ